MEVFDFSDCEENFRTYGGNAGRKAAVQFENSSWIIKYPGNLKKFNDIALDYSSSAISEYIGSHIYYFLDITVHETRLGFFDNKLVVACKDFCENDKLLAEFKTFKVTYREKNNKFTDGDGTNLSDILEVLSENKILHNIEGIERRFWDMFVIDAFIGNPDRNNSNWGLLVTFPERRILGLAPVYDNGNCLNSKWDDSRMRNFIKRSSKIQRILNSSLSIYQDETETKIYPFHFLNATTIPQCLISLVSIFEKINIENINKMIEDLYESKLISQLQADFYQLLLTKRYNIALKMNYEHALECLNQQNTASC